MKDIHPCIYLFIFFTLYIIFFINSELFSQPKQKLYSKSIRLNKKI